MKNIIFISFFLINIFKSDAQIVTKFQALREFATFQPRPVPWDVSLFRSTRFYVQYNVKSYNFGFFYGSTNYAISRPEFERDMTSYQIGLAFDKNFKFNKWNIQAAVEPYFRKFNQLLFTSSLVIDDYNYGLSLGPSFYYDFFNNKMVNLDLTYRYFFDFYSKSASLTGVTDFDRFPRFKGHTIGLSLIVNWDFDRIFGLNKPSKN